MNIAIIGAGFSGLALTWHMLQRAPAESQITLFEAKDIGGGASGIAAGLLHPYSGAHAKLNRMGLEGMEATLQLLEVSSKSLGSAVAIRRGILRPALDQEQKDDFLLCASRYPDHVDWLEAKECQKLFSPLVSAPGLWINNGWIVNSKLYLQGLWSACQSQGVHLEKKTIHSLIELSNFELIIIAVGGEGSSIKELASLPITTVKGQVLELEWPADLPPLSFALNSHAYLIMHELEKTCIVGSTFERGFQSIEPDWAVAVAEIMPKVTAMIPALENAHVLNCFAGIRSTSPNHLPITKQIDNKTWMISGMGSKGLLYHALVAKKLSDTLFG